MDDQKCRLQKFLSQAGVTSRRKAEELITEGRVTVNGKRVTELGVKVTPGRSRVTVDGKPVFWLPERIYVAVHKPTGYLTSLSDPTDRPIIRDLLPKKMPRVYPVGRLDWDSEGLVILTNDGDLTHRLMHPSFKVQRVYAVKVRGEIKDDGPVLTSLKQGVQLDEGLVVPDRVSVTGFTGKHTWLEIVLHSGANRVVRRMCEAVGHDVLRLRREAFGEVSLGSLPEGSYRDLSEAEVHYLYEATRSNMRQMPPMRSKQGKSRARSTKPSPRRPSSGGSGKASTGGSGKASTGGRPTRPGRGPTKKRRG